jgi:flagellin-like hook-associated protein FlgL
LNTGKAEIFLGNADGTFKSPSSFTVGDSLVLSLALGDFNGDGKIDIAASDYDSVLGQVAVLFGNGDGSFKSALQFPSVTSGSTVGAGDFNGDGIDDFVVARYQNNLASVFLSNGNGSFKAPINLQTTAPFSVKVGDFNGDGRLDFLTAQYGGTAQSFLGNGDGTFSAAASFSIAGNIFSVAMGDFDSDGRPDFVMAGASAVTVYSAHPAVAVTEAYVDLHTQQNARSALTSLTANLTRIDMQLGSLGASESRFNVDIQNLQSQRENYIAAAARITDADMAETSADLVRQQILQQASAAVLQHANLEPQLALTLLSHA